jgi:threonine dehydrogenase-like Zn-dependent dehydrogenase
VGTVSRLPAGYPGPIAPGDRVVAFVSLFCGECEQCRAGREQLCENLRILGCQTNGAFAEHVLIPTGNLIPIPSELSDRAAALTEPTSIAVHAVSCAGPVSDARTVVAGAGPIGLLVATVARNSGASPVVVLDISPFRLENARRAGFTALDASSPTLEADLEAALGGRLDLMFECAAQNSSVGLFVKLGRALSHMVVVGNYKSETPVHFFRMARNEQRISTSWLSSRGDYDSAIELLLDGVIDPDLVSTHVYPLDDIEAAFERARNASDAMRVLVEIRKE